MRKSQVTLDFWEQQLPNTLYNRLKDEEMKKLDALATTFPVSCRLIRDAFKEATTVFDVDFHVYDSCSAMLGWDLNNVYQYFKPYE